ncbi:MAG: hypothetical protein ACOC1K_01395 [Nanoarchaeota archaeon]
MEKVIKKKIKIKNLIGIVDNPTVEDLLFEIVSFLGSENRMDGEFKKWEVSQKTRSRINSEIIEDLEELEKKGYIEKIKYTLFKVLNHPWS